MAGSLQPRDALRAKYKRGATGRGEGWRPPVLSSGNPEPRGPHGESGQPPAEVADRGAEPLKRTSCRPLTTAVGLTPGEAAEGRRGRRLPGDELQANKRLLSPALSSGAVCCVATADGAGITLMYARHSKEHKIDYQELLPGGRREIEF